ncbi:MAG: hypothetical protein HY978_01900 [Candidatus Liptonbacteria bacterium]|nr:hypothetical protein [Candidatus Liptonbacteria bacterium]
MTLFRGAAPPEEFDGEFSGREVSGRRNGNGVPGKNTRGVADRNHALVLEAADNGRKHQPYINRPPGVRRPQAAREL